MKTFDWTILAGATVGFLLATDCTAADPAWELAGRGGISVSDGVPANDFLGFGLAAKYRLSDSNAIGLSIDSLEYDFERPWQVVGVEQDKTARPKDIDAKATTTLVSLFYERAYGRPMGRWNAYWTAGLGLASPDVKSATGPAVGGGTFDITTDAGTEFVPSLGGGVRLNVARNVSSELGLSAYQHLADWKVTDRNSGRSGAVDDYTRFGLHLGVSYRF